MKNKKHKILRKFFFEKITFGLNFSQCELIFGLYKRAIAGEFNKLAKEFYNSKNKPALYAKDWGEKKIIMIFDYFRFISKQNDLIF